MWDYLPLFLSSPQPPFYSTYSAMSMAHAHVLREDWKSLRTPKVWNNCLACHRGCAWFEYFVWWRWSIARLYDFVGITFFGHVILRRHNCLVSMLEVLLFLCQYELLSWIFRIWIFISQLRRFTLKLCQSITPHQKFFFIIYLLEDEQELSLGMLIRLRRIYNLMVCPDIITAPYWIWCVPWCLLSNYHYRSWVRH